MPQAAQLQLEQSRITSSNSLTLLFPGPRPRHPLSLPVPEDPSSQDTPAGAWGAQLIHMEKSMLRRVQLGHGNEMTLPEDPVEHTAYSFSGSPPGITASTTPHTQKGPESRWLGKGCAPDLRGHCESQP